jgi:putative oxidoreductase
MTPDFDSVVMLAARMALASLFLWGGAMKLVGYAAFVAYLHSAGVPLVPIAAPLSTTIDLLGGLCIVAGFKLRHVSWVMAVYTVATAILGHDFWHVADPVARHDMAVHFWKNMSIAGGFLLLSATGGGRFCVGQIFKRRVSAQQHRA